MKQLCARLLVIAVSGGLLASAGCIMGKSDLVITDKICVDIREIQTTGTFSTFVVADEFKEQLEKKLKEYDCKMKDVKSIHMVGAYYKTKTVKPHDWRVTCTIDIARQDVPEGAYEDGPAPFTRFQNQSLKALKGEKTVPPLHADGVKVVNHALDSLIDGEDPRLVLIVNNEAVTPTPSPSDPMEFKFEACVKFQIVIKGKDNHHGGGGGGHGR